MQRAFVVGSGPNGLSAAIVLAQAGLDVTVFEAEPTVGGGVRSAELTLPGFVHDICSAIHPMGVASPFFRSLGLETRGVEWINSPAPLAHPLDGGRAALLEYSLDETANALGADGTAYGNLFRPLLKHYDKLLDGILRPLIPPHHPFVLSRFGLAALRSANDVARHKFQTDAARALFAGMAAHAVQPLTALGSASFGLVLALTGHKDGWPLPRGGSQMIANALVAHLQSLGGKVVTSTRVSNADMLRDADIVMFDTAPRALIQIDGDRLPSHYRRRLARFRHGPGVFKLDWALSAPIPWTSPDCARAATVHVGGTFDEIRRSEHEMANGHHAERPFVILAQPSLFDATRAPEGRHTAWAYCHVPNGSTVDMTARVEAQIERFAPGFGDTILARRASFAKDLEEHNANYVGGDIVGGANTLLQTLARPVLSLHPYRVPVKGWFLCSSSTPPGGGVHGMCGYHAAHDALKSLGIRTT